MTRINHYPGLWWYISAVLVLGLGIAIAARHFPGGFDWHYTVASALASHQNNPDGSVWYAAGFGLSMALHWKYVSAIKDQLVTSQSGADRFALVSLRIGLAAGVLLGIEGVFVRDLGEWVPKGHEILGILAFTGLYLGMLVFQIRAMVRQRVYLFAALLVTVPLVAIGLSQLWLFLAQREIGWLNTDWRELGVPVWLSFAFWQWLAILFLTIGFASLSLIGKRKTV